MSLWKLCRGPGRLGEDQGPQKPVRMRTLVLLVLAVSFATAISEYINMLI